MNIATGGQEGIKKPQPHGEKFFAAEKTIRRNDKKIER